MIKYGSGKMTCGVYEIVNKETNQSYIGRSIDIENRWKGHLSAPSNNMAPTVKLYEEHPEMVELNIIRKIDEDYFDKEELKFITSVCELYELNQRGGWESEHLINGRDGDILACPPSILTKREYLPECIDIEDILYGIEKWNNDVYQYRASPNISLFNDISCKTDLDSEMYWRKQYLEIKDKYEDLKTKNTLLFIEEEKIHSQNYSDKMKIEYKYFKLEKDNVILKDQVDELKNNRDFWKERCISWRNKFLDMEKSFKKFTFPSNKWKTNDKNTSGVYRVSKCNNGWRYVVYENRKQIINIYGSSPQRLKEKVLSNGLDWKVLNEEKAMENGLI